MHGNDLLRIVCRAGRVLTYFFKKIRGIYFKVGLVAEKINNRMLYGVIAVLVLVLAYVAYANYIAPGQKIAKQQTAVDKIKKIYETITESPVEVLSVKEKNSIY